MQGPVIRIANPIFVVLYDPLEIIMVGTIHLSPPPISGWVDYMDNGAKVNKIIHQNICKVSWVAEVKQPCKNQQALPGMRC